MPQINTQTSSFEAIYTGAGVLSTNERLASLVHTVRSIINTGADEEQTVRKAVLGFALRSIVVEVEIEHRGFEAYPLRDFVGQMPEDLDEEALDSLHILLRSTIHSADRRWIIRPDGII